MSRSDFESAQTFYAITLTGKLYCLILLLRANTIVTTQFFNII